MSDGTTLTFGRYQGVPLDEIPTRYLRWVLRNVVLPTNTACNIERVLKGLPVKKCKTFEQELEEMIQPFDAENF